jgi:hypothetical protein
VVVFLRLQTTKILNGNFEVNLFINLVTHSLCLKQNDLVFIYEIKSNDKMVKRQNRFGFGFAFGCVFVSFNLWPKTKKKPRPSEQHRLYVIITHKDGFSLFNSHFLVKLTNHSRGIMTFCKQKFVRLFFYKKEFNHLII